MIGHDILELAAFVDGFELHCPDKIIRQIKSHFHAATFPYSQLPVKLRIHIPIAGSPISRFPIPFQPLASRADAHT